MLIASVRLCFVENKLLFCIENASILTHDFLTILTKKIAKLFKMIYKKIIYQINY